jgi:Ca2+-binding RTX toxin-like protein
LNQSGKNTLTQGEAERSYKFKKGASVSSVQTQNLIINGSFEQFDESAAVAKGDWWGVRSMPGWVLDGTQKDGSNWFEVVKSGHRGITTEYGSRWLDMDASSGNISIHQTVAGVEADKQYTLFVTLASSGKGEGVDVFWAGKRIASIVPDSLTMQTYSFVVVGGASPDANTIRLVGTGAANGIGVSLDDVSLVRNPDPVEVDASVPFVINQINEGTVNVETYKYGAGSGREFFVNFDHGVDKIVILADLAKSWADLQAKASIYQSEGSTVIEFHDGRNVMVFTQTDASKIGPQNFVFEGAPSIASRTVGGNLIKNGSFESVTTATSVTNSWGIGSLAIDGWTLSGTPRQGSNWFEMHTSGVRSVAAADGKYWLDLDASSGNIGMSQQVSGVEEGRFYTLSFNAASSRTGNSVDVFWDGVKIGTVTPDGTAMKEFSFVIEGHAGADMNRLSFSGTGTGDGYGVSLDNVRLFAHETVADAADVFSFGLDSGRQYVTNFDLGRDIIVIRSDFFENFEQMMQHVSVYQDGRTMIMEFDNGREVLVLPQFDKEKFSADMFKFEGVARTTIAQGRGDIRTGTDGDDTMITGAGNQTIDAGMGFDVLTGGVGADKFMFNAKSGHDFITDFAAGDDFIVISMDLAGSFEELLKNAAIYQDGNSTQIEFKDGQMITLFGVEAGRVSADWFAFV